MNKNEKYHADENWRIMAIEDGMESNRLCAIGFPVEPIDPCWEIYKTQIDQKNAEYWRGRRNAI